MNKVLIAIVLAVVGLGAIGLVVTVNNRQSSNTNVFNQLDQANKPTPAASSNSQNSQQMTATPVQEGAVSVEIKDFAFKSDSVTVKKGTTITWTNQDSAKHDVTVDGGDKSGFIGSGSLLAKGQSYSFTFNEVGDYSYNCSPHPYMKGKVEVVE